MRDWLLIFWFVSLWCPFVVLLLQLEPQELYWIDMEEMENLDLFLILVKSLWVSLHLVWCWLLACCVLPLLCLGMFLIFLLSLRPHERILYFVEGFFFKHLWKDHVVIFFSVCSYGGWHWQIFVYLTCLHLWDEA